MKQQSSAYLSRFMMIRRAFPFALCLLALCLGGCGTDNKTQTQAQAEEEEKVSTIPWNRPQKWESKNVMGGAGGVGY